MVVGSVLFLDRIRSCVWRVTIVWHRSESNADLSFHFDFSPSPHAFFVLACTFLLLYKYTCKYVRT